MGNDKVLLETSQLHGAERCCYSNAALMSLSTLPSQPHPITHPPLLFWLDFPLSLPLRTRVSPLSTLQKLEFVV